MSVYAVRYGHVFHRKLMELSQADYRRVEASVDVLADNPMLSHAYEPTYSLGTTLVGYRWYYVPKTHLMLFLVVDDGEHEMAFVELVSTSQDPLNRLEELVLSNEP